MIAAIISVIINQTGKLYADATQVEVSSRKINSEEVNAKISLKSKQYNGEYLELDARDKISLDHSNFSLVSSSDWFTQHHQSDNYEDGQEYVSLRQIIQQMSTGLKIKDHIYKVKESFQFPTQNLQKS